MTLIASEDINVSEVYSRSCTEKRVTEYQKRLDVLE